MPGSTPVSQGKYGMQLVAKCSVSAGGVLIPEQNINIASVVYTPGTNWTFNFSTALANTNYILVIWEGGIVQGYGRTKNTNNVIIAKTSDIFASDLRMQIEVYL